MAIDTVVTLTDARRNLADMLGGYRLFTTGVDEAVDGMYVGTPNGSDARRHVVSSDLVVLDFSGASTPMATDRWKHAVVYFPSIPIQRQVAEKGYSGAKLASEVTDQAALTTTYVGMLTLAEQLAAAPAPSLECELHSVMPPISREHGRGLHACINRALRAMTFRKVIAFTTVSGARRYNLSAYPWIGKGRQLIGVFDSESDAMLQPEDLSGGGEIIFDGHIPYLQIDSGPSGMPFYAAFRRPIGSWVRTGGSWANSTSGLVNETDAVFVDPDILATCSYYYACEALARAWRNDPAGKTWAEERDATLGAASLHLVLDTQLSNRPMRGSRFPKLAGRSGSASTSWPA